MRVKETRCKHTRAQTCRPLGEASRDQPNDWWMDFKKYKNEAWTQRKKGKREGWSMYLMMKWKMKTTHLWEALDGDVWVLRGVLPACEGVGDPGQRGWWQGGPLSSSPPPAPGSAVQTAPPAPWPTPAELLRSHTAPYTLHSPKGREGGITQIHTSSKEHYTTRRKGSNKNRHSKEQQDLTDAGFLLLIGWNNPPYLILFGDWCRDAFLESYWNCEDCTRVDPLPRLLKRN